MTEAFFPAGRSVDRNPPTSTPQGARRRGAAPPLLPLEAPLLLFFLVDGLGYAARLAPPPLLSSPPLFPLPP